MIANSSTFRPEPTVTSALKKVTLLIALCVAACGITPSHVDVFNLDAQRYGNGGDQGGGRH
jgi:hypothetical protein